jgi:hypothetical protein
MKGHKLMYVFGDPLGAKDSKVGITGSPYIRLGVYQNSYSRNSHVACFDVVYIGPAGAINRLEKTVKQELDLDIERDGRGHSEWVSMPYAEIEKHIDKIIDGHKFKVTKVTNNFLPLNSDNMETFLNYYIDKT